MLGVPGVDAKIDRAWDQTHLLTRDITDFCDAQEQLIRHHRDSAGQTWRFEGETPSAPIEYSVRVGEIVHDLRSALDRFVHELVLVNGEEPGRCNGFPIFLVESTYRDMAERKLKGVSESARQAIELHQPFQRPGNAGYTLWLLEAMSDHDKHGTLSMDVVVKQKAGSTVARGDPGEGAGSTYPRPLAKNRTLLRVDDPDVEYDVEFVTNVQFGYASSPQPSSRDALPRTYQELLTAVAKYGPAGRSVVSTLIDLVGDVNVLLADLCGRTGILASPVPDGEAARE